MKKATDQVAFFLSLKLNTFESGRKVDCIAAGAAAAVQFAAGIAVGRTAAGGIAAAFAFAFDFAFAFVGSAFPFDFGFAGSIVHLRLMQKIKITL
jgi:hypothetical protein